MAIKKPNSNQFYWLKLLFSSVELQIYTLRHLAMIAAKLRCVRSKNKRTMGVNLYDKQISCCSWWQMKVWTWTIKKWYSLFCNSKYFIYKIQILRRMFLIWLLFQWAYKRNKMVKQQYANEFEWVMHLDKLVRHIFCFSNQ